MAKEHNYVIDVIIFIKMKAKLVLFKASMMYLYDRVAHLNSL